MRQQESNLRWGSQSPLPYRLAMAHRARYYIIFFVFPQGEGSTFPLLRRLCAAFCSLQFVKNQFFHHNNRIRPFCCAFVTLYVVNIGLNKPPLPGFFVYCLMAGTSRSVLVFPFPAGTTSQFVRKARSHMKKILKMLVLGLLSAALLCLSLIHI